MSDYKRDILNTKAEAYFTIEASFIIPLTCFIFGIIIYFTFFLYNNCVVNQSAYIAALRGQELKNVSNQAIKSYVDDQLQILLDDQVYQYQVDYAASVNIADIKVEAKSEIDNKLASVGLYTGHMKSDKKSLVLRFNPSEFIRINHKM